MERTALKKAEATEKSVKEEGVFSELASDAWAIGVGIKNGVVASAKDAVEHPGDFAFRCGVVATTGFVLGGLQARAGLLRFAAQAALVGGTISAVRNLGDAAFMDPGLKAGLTSEARLNHTGEKIGHFLFDTAVFTGVGLGTAKLSQKMMANVEFTPRTSETPHWGSSYDRLMLEKMNTPRHY